MKKPLIVYVSGAPGSGKTTLASKIAMELFIPHISSDLVHGGVRLTAGMPIDRRQSLHDVFVPTMIEMSKFGVSFVVDHVLQKDMSKQDIIDYISPYAHIVYIHTRANQPIARHLERELSRIDRGKVLNNIELRERASYHQANLAQTADPVEIGVKPFCVDTTDGYSPSFTQIIDYIEDNYKGVQQ